MGLGCKFTTIGILAFCLISTPVSRADEPCGSDDSHPFAQLEKFAKENFFNLPIVMDLTAHCKDNAVQDFVAYETGCDMAASKLVVDLDSSSDYGNLLLMKHHRGTITFTNEFNREMQSTEIRKYLSALDGELDLLDSSYSPSKPFRLWDWTVQQAGGDHEKALKWIAVLFQDEKLEHIIDMIKLNGQENAPNVRQYESVAQKLFTAISQSPSSVQPYPQNRKNADSAGMYHYYVPAYTATLLQKELKVPNAKALARYMPTLFDADYEFFQHLPVQKGDQDPAFPHIFDVIFEPTSLNPSNPNYPHILDAVYDGYAGSSWAVGETPQSFEDFKKSFTANPKKFLSGLLKSDS
jgi:hypothetical protein